MATKTTGNLLPGGVNTPLDARFAVDTLNDVEQMQNPVLGGIFYCRADGKHYKITELESKLVGAITVANAKVKSYEEFGGNPEEIAAINTSLAGLQSTVNTHEGLITDNKNAASNLLTQYNGLDTRLTALSGTVAGKMDTPAGGSAGQVLTQTSGGGVQWQTPAAGGLDSAGVLSAVSSGGYITSSAVNSKLDMYVLQSTYGMKMNEITLALDGKASTEELAATSSALDTRMTAAEGNITGLNNLPKLSIVQSSTAPENPSNGTIWIPTESIAYSVLDLIAPDPEHVTDIPAWNTVYKATAACWVAVSIVGCAGAVLLGTEAQYVDSHPMGFYVGGGTDSVYSFVFCPKGWFYKAFLSSTTATLSYSHKQIWKCKGA